MIIVVGIGADGMAGLAPASRAELSRATVVYGSRRQLDLLDATVTAVRRAWPTPMLPALRAIFDGADGDVHVVASGDPLLHGIGNTLIRLYGPDRVAVLPHVSSVTLACSRVGWSVHDTEVISLVTRLPHTAVRRGGQAVVMSRDGASPATLARLLTDSGRGESEITVLEQLGGPVERRRSATAREWAVRPPGDVDDLNVVAVRYLPDERQFATLPDDCFAHDGQITKQPMRARDTGGAGATPRRAAVGRRRRIGQHSDRVVPQRSRVLGNRIRAQRETPQADRRECRGVRRQRRGALRCPRVV